MRRNVRMHKEELEGIVRANKATHRDQFERMVDGYRLR